MSDEDGWHLIKTWNNWQYEIYYVGEDKDHKITFEEGEHVAIRRPGVPRATFGKIKIKNEQRSYTDYGHHTTVSTRIYFVEIMTQGGLSALIDIRGHELRRQDP